RLPVPPARQAGPSAQRPHGGPGHAGADPAGRARLVRKARGSGGLPPLEAVRGALVPGRRPLAETSEVLRLHGGGAPLGGGAADGGVRAARDGVRWTPKPTRMVAIATGSPY